MFEPCQHRESARLQTESVAIDSWDRFHPTPDTHMMYEPSCTTWHVMEVSLDAFPYAAAPTDIWDPIYGISLGLASESHFPLTPYGHWCNEKRLKRWPQMHLAMHVSQMPPRRWSSQPLHFAGRQLPCTRSSSWCDRISHGTAMSVADNRGRWVATKRSSESFGGPRPRRFNFALPLHGSGRSVTRMTRDTSPLLAVVDNMRREQLNPTILSRVVWMFFCWLSIKLHGTKSWT